ncbi:MAG: HK97 family phage prohead protease [Asticcacaulis sp.]|uniref:HK97 family phage prohead protease n=1 Tax=Asticcacaulis sp. TaxID=1872648 RepID=UPI003F7B99DC
MSVHIEGYASRFGLRDLNDDVVVPGAFRDSLMQSGPGGVRMLYQHQVKSPVGVWDEMVEDAVGLFVRGRILDVSPEARMVGALVRTGVVDGLSIGFRAVKSRASDGGRLRVLTAVELWEVSIVTFPMLPSARITRVWAEAVAA